MKKLLLFSLLLQTILLFSTWWSYHLFVPKNVLLNTPLVKQDPSTRFTTIGESLVHNQIFTTKGWSKNPDEYISLYGGLSPLSNIFWHAPQYGIYAGRFLKRQSLYNDLLTQEITLSPTVATISASALSLLSTSGVQEIHSFLPINNDLLPLEQTIQSTHPLYLYKNSISLDQAYIAKSATTASTLRQAVTLLTNAEFATNKTALISVQDADTVYLLHDAIQSIQKLPKNIHVSISRPTHTRVSVSLSPLEVPSILVLSDTYYPDWNAFVDGKETTIFPVNLTYRAIVIPKESKEVIFSYTPKSVRLGIQLSLFTHTLIVIAVMVQFFLSNSRRKSTTRQQ